MPIFLEKPVFFLSEMNWHVLHGDELRTNNICFM